MSQMGNVNFGPAWTDAPQIIGTAQTGWICPKCRATMAPSTPYCFFCAPKKTETTESTSTQQSLLEGK